MLILVASLIIITAVGFSCCLLCYAFNKLRKAKSLEKPFREPVQQLPRVSGFVRSVALQPPSPAPSTSYEIFTEQELSPNRVAAANPVPPAAPELLLYGNSQIPENREQILYHQNELEGQNLDLRANSTVRLIQPNSSNPVFILLTDPPFVTHRRNSNSTGNLRVPQSNHSSSLGKCKSLRLFSSEKS